MRQTRDELYPEGFPKVLQGSNPVLDDLEWKHP